jgi:hypothetical protein
VGHEHTEQPNNSIYLKFLREFRNKVDLQITLEREEMTSITHKVSSQFKDYKAKLMEGWNLLDTMDKTILKTAHFNMVETKHQEKYTDLEREYLQKEKKADGFQFDRLSEIKQKLKLLEEAEISESRECFPMSADCRGEVIHSRERVLGEESEVYNLLRV